MVINLLPQEQSTQSNFNSPVFMTRGFKEVFKGRSFFVAVNALLKIHKERVRSSDGADYFQVAEHNGIKFYVIDDVSHVTFLMPEDY